MDPATTTAFPANYATTVEPVPRVSRAEVQTSDDRVNPLVVDLATEKLPGDSTTMLPGASADPQAAPVPCHI
jgi:hypothetical protein